MEENPLRIEGLARKPREILGSEDPHLREDGEERRLGFGEKEMEAMRERKRGRVRDRYIYIYRERERGF